MRRKSLLGLTIALLFTSTLAACGDDDSSVKGSAAASTSDTTADATTTTSTTAAGPATQSSVPATSPKRFLTDAKTLRVDGHDVVQFTFEGGTPGYSAEYITPPITDEGQGAAVAVSGNNVIKLAFESAGTIDLSGGSKQYYNGPNRITSTDTKVVSELVKVSEYEGRLLFGIGTRTKANFVIAASGNVVTVSFP